MTTTTPTFNLVDQPWIPCVWLDGRRELLGLEAVLVRAHELRDIYDDSPLVTVSLHRLLLALVHHALRGPARMSDWATLWRNGEGRFDETLFTLVPRLYRSIAGRIKLGETLEAVFGKVLKVADEGRKVISVPFLPCPSPTIFSGATGSPWRNCM